MYRAADLTSTKPTPAAPQDLPLPPPFLGEGEGAVTEEEREEGEVILPLPPSHSYKSRESEASFTDKAQWKNHFKSEQGGKIYSGAKREDFRSHVKKSHL